MNCRHHEEGLLLLAHNAANPLQRWQLRRHLDTCTVCQDRFQRLQRASRALAAGIRRGSDLPDWRLPAAAALRRTLPRRLAGVPLLLATAAAVAGLTAVGYQAYRIAYPRPAACESPSTLTP